MTEHQLLQALAREGYGVSSDQLKRWRRAGLLPRPTQAHHVGRAGSDSTYPPGTLAQALAVCRRHTPGKPVEKIRFELWWAGEYTGELEPVRRHLVGQLEKLLTPLREIRDRYDDPLEAAEAAVTGDGFTSRNPVFRAMRRFAKTDENLRSAATLVLWDLFGGEVDWDSPDTGAGDQSPREIVEQAIGATRAKNEVTESGETLLSSSSDVIESIQLIARTGVIDLDHPGSAIAGATNQTLEQAAATTRTIIEGFGSLARFATYRHSRDYAGLSILAGFAKPDPTLVAMAMQMTLHLSSLLTTEQEREHAANTFQALESHQNAMTCFELFSNEHPGYTFIFKADQSRVQVLAGDERELITQTIADFVQHHPECRAVMTDPPVN